MAFSNSARDFKLPFADQKVLYVLFRDHLSIRRLHAFDCDWRSKFAGSFDVFLCYYLFVYVFAC